MNEPTLGRDLLDDIEFVAVGRQHRQPCLGGGQIDQRHPRTPGCSISTLDGFGRLNRRLRSFGCRMQNGSWMLGENRAMSVVGTARGHDRSFFSIDISWQNIIFSLRTAAAAILALALAYWLELSDPQWATLTVYLLAQPTVGGALAKGAWRAVGTVAGGLIGLVLVALFSQAAVLLVAATVLLVGASFYAGARLRNFTSYGVLLGGYTMLLVAYEGSTDPLNAWSIAVDRIAEILIGIACGALTSVIILPRYAGDALREAQADTVSGLAHYVATALHLSTPAAVFARLRKQMVAEVVSFDALRASALFETRELRANEEYLRRIVREFLIVLSVARGLFVRLEEFDSDDARQVHDRLRPTLEAIAARIESFAADPAARSDPRGLRHEILAARIALKRTAADLEGMAGTAPFDPLADGLLILNRVGELLHGLAMMVVTETASLRGAASRTRRREQRDTQGRQEALLIAVRAALVMLVLSCWWLATGWSDGLTAVSGGIIMLFFAVNQDNALAGGRTYLVWGSAGILFGYVVIILVLPYLQGFGSLAVVLLLVLLPAGLMAGTPSHAWAGIALGGWTVAEIGFGNAFKPDELSLVSGAVALILGMIGCLAVIAAMPVTSHARRRQSWQRAIGTILPAVARGGIVPRRGANEIVAMLAALLPRFALDRQRDEDFFRGTLGAASSAIELGRLVALGSDSDMPQNAARAIAHFLERFAVALESLAASRANRQARLAEAEAIVAELRADLGARALERGAAARSILRAAASLRFIADRFYIDRAYLDRR